jgi:hypothetical protein
MSYFLVNVLAVAFFMVAPLLAHTAGAAWHRPGSLVRRFGDRVRQLAARPVGGALGRRAQVTLAAAPPSLSRA